MMQRLRLECRVPLTLPKIHIIKLTFSKKIILQTCITRRRCKHWFGSRRILLGNFEAPLSGLNTQVSKYTSLKIAKGRWKYEVSLFLNIKYYLVNLGSSSCLKKLKVGCFWRIFFPKKIARTNYEFELLELGRRSI